MMGESLADSPIRRSTWRTSTVSAGDHRPGQPGQAEVAVRYLTIHYRRPPTQYYDNPYMTLGRGGQDGSDESAEKIGVRDNEWIEAKNRNGARVGSRCSLTASRGQWCSCTTPRIARSTPC